MATDGTRTFVGFLYEDIQWTGGIAIGFDGINVNPATTIGFNAGDGIRSFTLPEFLTAGSILNLESTSNVGIPGVYWFRVDRDQVEAPGNTTLPTPGDTKSRSPF